mgnify:CR=1 FL=1
MSLNDKFKEILIDFLHFFSKNYLLIGNSCSFKIHQHKYCVKSVIFSNDDEYILVSSITPRMYLLSRLIMDISKGKVDAQK